MKYFVVIAFLFAVASQSFAQLSPEKALYIQKADKYRRMKGGGVALTVVGGILAIVGIGTLANSSYETYYNGNTGQTTTTTHGNPEAGAVAFLLGAAGLGAGIPLTIVGTHNQRKYERRIENLSVKLNLNPQRTGLRLIYRF